MQPENFTPSGHRLRRYALFLGIWTLLAVLSAVETYVSQAVFGPPVPWSLAFRRSFEEWYSWAFLSLGVIWLGNRLLKVSDNGPGLPKGESEHQLPVKHFTRIGRSVIVHLDRIKELQPLFYGDYAVILLDGTRLTLSRNYRDRLEKFLARNG